MGRANRSIVGWRVRQGVTLRTENLAALPKTVAAAQSLLSLGGIDFRLSKAARERVEGQLIQQAIANFNARVAAAAQALGVPPARVRIEELNFGGREGGPVPVAAARMAAMASDAVPAPSFEAGRSSERLTRQRQGAPAALMHGASLGTQVRSDTIELPCPGARPFELSASAAGAGRLAIHRRRSAAGCPGLVVRWLPVVAATVAADAVRRPVLP